MNSIDKPRPSWLVAASASAALYLIIGITFQGTVRWRLAAWLVSAVLLAAHIWYEHFRQRSSPRTSAWHVALAVALAGLGLAVAAAIHNRHILVLALLLWPILVGAPAFLVALFAAAALGLARRNANSDSTVTKD